MKRPLGIMGPLTCPARCFGINLPVSKIIFSPTITTQHGQLQATRSPVARTAWMFFQGMNLLCLDKAAFAFRHRRHCFGRMGTQSILISFSKHLTQIGRTHRQR